MKTKGLIIRIEGPIGSRKSTIANLIKDLLEANDMIVHVEHELGCMAMKDAKTALEEGILIVCTTHKTIRVEGTPGIISELKKEDILSGEQDE
jgi:thymidylate kinase